MLTKSKYKILLALGSNTSDDLSESLFLIQSAVAEMVSGIIVNPNISQFYQTPAFPAGRGPDFVNCCVYAETETVPAQLLPFLHGIEAKLGRERVQRWGQRTVDIDLIGCEDLIKPDVETFTYWQDLPLAQQMTDAPTELILPHPRIQDRAFVLVPLADVAPNWRHPVLGKTTLEMRDALPADLLAEVRLLNLSE